jgi:hypothetical protein
MDIYIHVYYKQGGQSFKLTCHHITVIFNNVRICTSTHMYMYFCWIFKFYTLLTSLFYSIKCEEIIHFDAVNFRKKNETSDSLNVL